MSYNVILVEIRACCHVANAFVSRLQLIVLISRLKLSKVYTFAKELLLSKYPRQRLKVRLNLSHSTVL